jgi:hypothetical protein
MALFSPVIGNTAKISGVPVTPGQFLINSETKGIYVDSDGSRINIGISASDYAADMGNIALILDNINGTEI